MTFQRTECNQLLRNWRVQIYRQSWQDHPRRKFDKSCGTQKNEDVVPEAKNLAKPFSHSGIW